MESVALTPQFVGICFAVAATAVAVTLWITSNYQSKSAAKDLEDRMNRELEEVRGSLTSLWNKVNEVQGNMMGIAKDVAYIRGRLEPKT